MDMYKPAHPGAILYEEWILPLGFSIAKFALRIGTSRKNLSEIVNGKTGISPEMSLRLSKALGTSAQFWLDLQTQYDLYNARQNVNLDNIEIIAN